MVILASSFCKPKSSFKPTVIQQVLEYREFDYRDPRNTGIFLMVTINLEYQDFPGKIRIP